MLEVLNNCVMGSAGSRNRVHPLGSSSFQLDGEFEHEAEQLRLKKRQSVSGGEWPTPFTTCCRYTESVSIQPHDAHQMRGYCRRCCCAPPGKITCTMPR